MRKRLLLTGGILLLAVALIAVGAILEPTDTVTGNGPGDESATRDDTQDATSSPWPGSGTVDVPPTRTPSPTAILPPRLVASLPQGPSAVDECLAVVAAGAEPLFTHTQPQGTPVAEWRGVPIMPGAIVAKETSWAEQSPGLGSAGYHYTIAASPAEIWTYYLAEMPGSGWFESGCDWAWGHGPTPSPFLIFGESLAVSVHIIAEVDPDSGQTFVFLNYRSGVR